jgi:hypothetical protein
MRKPYRRIGRISLFWKKRTGVSAPDNSNIDRRLKDNLQGPDLVLLGLETLEMNLASNLSTI